MLAKPTFKKPTIAGDLNIWGNKLNEIIDRQDDFNRSIVDDSNTQNGELARLENEKISKSELDTFVSNKVDNYIDEYGKPILDNYINTVNKPSLDNYTDGKKAEINQYVETVSKVDINSHIEKKKVELDEYNSVKKTELDSHEKLKEGQLDDYTLIKKSELDAYEKVKEGELTSITNTKKEELTAHANTEIQNITNHTESKKIEINSFTNEQKSELDAYEKIKEDELNTHTSKKKEELDSYTLTKSGELDTHTVKKKEELDSYIQNTSKPDIQGFVNTKVEESNQLITTHTDLQIERINASGIDEKLDKGGYIGTAQDLDAEIKKKATIQQLQEEIKKIIGNSPETLDTLQEIATALGNDPNFATTMTNMLSQKLDKGTYDGNAGDLKTLIDNLITSKQNKEDTNLITTSKNIVNAINEIKRKSETFDSSKQDKIDNTLTTSDKTVAGAINELNKGKPSKTTQVIAGNGLAGGGDLSESRTINVVAGNDSLVVSADSITVNTTDDIATVSSTRPASATAVKKAYDRGTDGINTANTKVSKSGDTMTGTLALPSLKVNSNIINSNGNNMMRKGGEGDAVVIGNYFGPTVIDSQTNPSVRVGGTNSEFPIYHTGNKPTPADIGAININGGTMKGDLGLSSGVSIRVPRPNDPSSKSWVFGELNGNLYLGETVLPLKIRSSINPTVLVGSGAEKKFYHEGFKPSASDVRAIPINTESGTPVACYLTTNEQKPSTGTKIRLPFLTNATKMMVFTVRIYQSYKHTDIKFSGYLYAQTNQWFEPDATIISSNSAGLQVKMGRDTDGKAYVWIQGGNYRGIAVLDVVGGYSYADWNKGWEITLSNDTPNVIFDRALTPPWTDSNCPASFGATGYQKLASGLIIQWGEVNATGAWQNITLPISFSNTTYKVIINHIVGRDGQGGNYSCTILNNNSFRTAGFSGWKISYVAIGN